MVAVVDARSSAAPRRGFRLTPEALAAAVVAGAAAVRLAAFLVSLDDPYLAFRQGDEAYYHEWARAILAGGWQRGTPFFTTPLYAYFLALAYGIGGQAIAWIRFLNVVMGTGTVALTFLAARRLLGGRAGVAAAALTAFCAAPVFYEWLPEKTTLVLFLTALAFFLVVRADGEGGPGAWLAAGLAGGVASLGHTLLLVALPAVWGHVALSRRGARGDARRAIALYSLGFVLGIAPATLHNWLQDGSFVPVCTTGGVTFYIGNHAGNLTGRYASPPFATSNADSEERDFVAEAGRRAGRVLKPAEASAYWFRQAWVEIAADPGLSLRRWWRRLRWTFGDAENTDSRTFEFYRERHPVLLGTLWGFGLVSLLGLVGLVGLGAARDRALVFTAGFTLLFAAGMSAILVYGRYRLPLLVPLSLLAAAGLDRALGLARDRRWPRLAAAGVAAAVLAWFVYAPVLSGVPVDFATDYSNQGNRLWDARQYDRAFEEYEKALRVRPGVNPGVPRLYVGLARIYAGRGELRRAEELLREGAARHPADSGIRSLLEEVQRRAAARPPSP